MTLQRFLAKNPLGGDKVPMANMIVEWHPERKERILLVAHYDTRPLPDRDPDPVKRKSGMFIGANDGGSGIAVLMELAHLMPKLEGPIGVDFLLVDGEELVYVEDSDPYFLGSTWFAKQYVRKCRQRTSIAGASCWTWWAIVICRSIRSSSVSDVARHAAAGEGDLGDRGAIGREGIHSAGRIRRAGRSSCRCATLAKIPTCDIIDFADPAERNPLYWHTTLIRPQRCSGSSLAKVGWVVYEWLKGQELNGKDPVERESARSRHASPLRPLPEGEGNERMIATYIVSLLLIGLSGVLLDMHRRSWRAAEQDASLSASDRRFARSQYRRRTQASGIIGVLGAGDWRVAAGAARAVADGAVPGVDRRRLLGDHAAGGDRCLGDAAEFCPAAQRAAGRTSEAGPGSEAAMTVDPFRLAIALVPVAAYVLLLGLVNLRRRPFLTSGGSDLTALGVALSGLMFVGPLELFRPEAATRSFGNYIWLFLLLFYWLWLVLVVLLSRPRLVIYNISAEELHPVLAEAAARLDPAARWAGNQLVAAGTGRAAASRQLGHDAKRVAGLERQPAEHRRLAAACARAAPLRCERCA